MRRPTLVAAALGLLAAGCLPFNAAEERWCEAHPGQCPHRDPRCATEGTSKLLACLREDFKTPLESRWTHNAQAGASIDRSDGRLQVRIAPGTGAALGTLVSLERYELHDSATVLGLSQMQGPGTVATLQLFAKEGAVASISAIVIADAGGNYSVTSLVKYADRTSESKAGPSGRTPPRWILVGFRGQQVEFATSWGGPFATFHRLTLRPDSLHPVKVHLEAGSHQSAPGGERVIAFNGLFPAPLPP